MSLVTIIWSMIASACLTLAGLHFLVWCRKRTAWSSLFFSLMSGGTGVAAFFELGMMTADNHASFAFATRWIHVPNWIVILALVGFIRTHLKAGRRWLAWTVCVMRSVTLILNFLVGQNLNFLEVTGIKRIPFLGESVSVGEGVLNPLMLLGQASLLMFILYIADAVIAVWRRGDRRKALVAGGSILLFVLAGTVSAGLVYLEIAKWPFMASLFFMGIVVVMSYELSRDAIRAVQLSADLQETNERFHQAAQAAEFGVYEYDCIHDKASYSAEFMALYGLPMDAVLELDADRVPRALHPEDRDVYKERMRAASDPEGSGVFDVEFRILLPEGPIRWLRAKGRTRFGGTRSRRFPLRSNGIILDITDRKKAELEFQRSRAEITHLSRVAMLGELSGSIAHELNQPLTAILSNAQAAQRFLAEDNADLAEIRDILKDIVTDDQRAGEVIRRLRLLLKKGETHHSQLDLHDVMQEVLRLIRNDLLNHNIMLLAEFMPGRPVIKGDRVQMQQVLLNLIVNATDAMAGGDRAVEKILRVRTDCPKAGAVRVTVADSGTGLNTEALAGIFTPFFTTKITGMGLGLKVSQTIVKAHGGELDGRNNPGRGAVFSFTLPLAEGRP